MTAQRPRRVQLSRSKGWRMPPNTVSVARPTRWGNPYVPGTGMVAWSGATSGDVGFYGDRRVFCDQAPLHPLTVTEAVQLYRDELVASLADEDPFFDDLREALAGLRGKNLACWCPLDQPCHADALLEVAVQ